MRRCIRRVRTMSAALGSEGKSVEGPVGPETSVFAGKQLELPFYGSDRIETPLTARGHLKRISDPLGAVRPPIWSPFIWHPDEI